MRGPAASMMQQIISKRDAWILCKQLCRGVFLAFSVIGGSQILVFWSDIAAWAFLVLVMTAVVVKGRKPGRTMRRIFSK
jgi:hypothetical protein